MARKKTTRSTRPYRLWNPVEKCWYRWRYYKTAHNAHWGALKECRWAKPGVTIECVNSNTGRLFAQYTRTETSIKFAKG